MNNLDLNTYAVLSAAVSGMLLGALWYSPVAFGTLWMRALGKSESELGSPLAPMLGSMIACLLSATALAVLIDMAAVRGLSAGIVTGLIIGLGVIFPALLSDNLFCGWGARLLLIQSGYRVLYCVVMCAILACWPA